jgi:hypothetical protein
MLFCTNDQQIHLIQLLARYQLNIHWLADNAPIPGSWFGAPEAGIIKNQLYLRIDTPVHSALHEACHYICMDNRRRVVLDTDAAGDYIEENGVCFMQILLADFLPDMGKNKMMQDMDTWGYTFRLGSAQRWFEEDAEDTQQWLINNQLIDMAKQPTWKVRQ